MTVFLIFQTFSFPSTSSPWFLNSSSNQQNIPLYFSFLFLIFPFVLFFNSYFLLQFYLIFYLHIATFSLFFRRRTYRLTEGVRQQWFLLLHWPASLWLSDRFPSIHMLMWTWYKIVIPIRGLFLYLHFLCGRRISISSRLRSARHLQYWTEYFKEYDILSKYLTKTNIEQTSFNIWIKLLQTKTAVYGK